MKILQIVNGHILGMVYKGKETSASDFRTTSLSCTYKLCDYYSPIPNLSFPFYTIHIICDHSQSAGFFNYLLNLRYYIPLYINY